jgi:hypothetical protein
MSEEQQKKPGRPANCQNCHLSKTLCPCGRPTKFNEEVVTKLQEAYMIGANHKQATYHARISLSTLHSWLKQNDNFSELVEEWRERPTLRALNKVFESLATNENSAWRWLERRHPDFTPVRRYKHSGDDNPDNKPIKFERIIVEMPAGYEENEVRDPKQG